MRALAFLGIAAGIVCSASTVTTPASAGLVAYLSRAGGGTACTKVAPCDSMTTAIGVAGSGGEVICLDKGGYGGAVISFSINISCGDGLWEAHSAGVSINGFFGSADVAIEGLVADPLGVTGSILVFSGQGALHLRRVRINGSPSFGNASAIQFLPSGGPARLFVSDSYLYNFGASGTTSAIFVKTLPGATGDVVIERTRIENNRFGIIASGSDGGAVRGVVRDSVIAGNANNGITVSTTGSNVVLTVDGCTISGNNFGLVATGANAGMLVRRSVINGNTTGLNTGSGGVLLSYGDNSVNGNNAGETFSGPVGLK